MPRRSCSTALQPKRTGQQLLPACSPRLPQSLQRRCAQSTRAGHDASAAQPSVTIEEYPSVSANAGLSCLTLPAAHAARHSSHRARLGVAGAQEGDWAAAKVQQGAHVLPPAAVAFLGAASRLASSQHSRLLYLQVSQPTTWSTKFHNPIIA